MMKAEPIFPGFGGVIAPAPTIRAIWKEVGSQYRRLLGEAYTEAVLRRHDALASGESSPLSSPEVLAARVARERGALAESQLLARPDLMVGKKQFIQKYGQAHERRYVDPLSHVRMELLNDTCIAWSSNVDPTRIEESPLLESMITACEKRIFEAGYGAVHFAVDGTADVPIWQAGSGAAVVTGKPESTRPPRSERRAFTVQTADSGFDPEENHTCPLR